MLRCGAGVATLLILLAGCASRQTSSQTSYQATAAPAVPTAERGAEPLASATREIADRMAAAIREYDRPPRGNAVVLLAHDAQGRVTVFGTQWANGLFADMVRREMGLNFFLGDDVDPTNENAIFEKYYGGRKCFYRIQTTIGEGDPVPILVRLLDWEGQTLAVAQTTVPAALVAAGSAPATALPPHVGFVLDADTLQRRKQIAATVARLLSRRPTSSATVLLLPDKSPPRYRVGERVGLRVRSDMAGYLNVFNIDPAGHPALLIPNTQAREYRIAAGQVVTVFPMEFSSSTRVVREGREEIKVETRSVEVEVQSPVGRDLFWAIVTDKPLDWGTMTRRHEAGERFYGVEDAETFTLLDRDLDHLEWAAGMLEIVTFE
ncbi:MAG: DUF4384 domain-containing protein [Candidatus Sumerlaeia bacterium]|nr:DUF4384 domain-containing protein [Candidatus Sumerlaeia bacterium]